MKQSRTSRRKEWRPWNDPVIDVCDSSCDECKPPPEHPIYSIIDDDEIPTPSQPSIPTPSQPSILTPSVNPSSNIPTPNVTPSSVIPNVTPSAIIPTLSSISLTPISIFPGTLRSGSTD